MGSGTLGRGLWRKSNSTLTLALSAGGMSRVERQPVTPVSAVSVIDTCVRDLSVRDISVRDVSGLDL